jgi:hypothetical protein
VRGAQSENVAVVIAIAGGFLFAVIVGFAVGRFWIVPLPLLIIGAWTVISPPREGDDVPSLAAILLYAALLGVPIGVVVRKLWRLRPRSSTPRMS